MTLHAVGAADHQNGIIQHLKGTLHFCRKVHMSGRIHQCDLQFGQRQDGLLGKDGDTAFPFQLIVVEKGILVVNTAQFIDAAAEIQHTLGKGRFSRVNMSQNTDHKFFHIHHPKKLLIFQECP